MGPEDYTPNVDPFKMAGPTYGTPPVDASLSTDTPPVGTTGTSEQSPVSDEQALKFIPPAINYVDVAAAQKEKQEVQANNASTPTGLVTSPIRQSTGERASDSTFKVYDRALNTLQNQNEFTHNGQSYFKDGNDTYMLNSEVPGGVVRVDPNAAAKIDAARLQQVANTPQVEPDTRQKYRMATEQEIQQEINSPSLPILNFVGQTASQGIAGGLAAGPAGAAAGAASGAVGALWSGTPDWMKKSYENTLRTQPSVPIFENMTPDEIATYYGRP